MRSPDQPESSVAPRKGRRKSAAVRDPMEQYLAAINDLPLLSGPTEHALGVLFEQVEEATTRRVRALREPLLALAKTGGMRKTLDRIGRIVLPPAKDEPPDSPRDLGQVHGVLSHLVWQYCRGRPIGSLLSEKRCGMDASVIDAVLTITENRGEFARTIMCHELTQERIECAGKLLTIGRKSLAVLREDRGTPFRQAMEDVNVMVRCAFRTDPALQAYLVECLEDGASLPPVERMGAETPQDIFTRANLRLVVNIARSYMDRGIPIQDLIGMGNIGLIRAVMGFDPAMDTRFSTYASYWIKQTMKIGCANFSRLLRIPAYMMELRRKYVHLRGGLGREPTDEETIARLDLTRRKLKNLKRALQFHQIHPDAHSELPQQPCEEILDMPREDCPQECSLNVDPTVDGAIASEEARLVHAALERLKKVDNRAWYVITRRVPLDGGKGATLRAIGKKLGITRECVRQIELETFDKLAALMRRAAREGDLDRNGSNGRAGGSRLPQHSSPRPLPEPAIPPIPPPPLAKGEHSTQRLLEVMDYLLAASANGAIAGRLDALLPACGMDFATYHALLPRLPALRRAAECDPERNPLGALQVIGRSIAALRARMDRLTCSQETSFRNANGSSVK